MIQMTKKYGQRYRQLLKEMGFSNNEILARMTKNLNRMKERKK